MLFLDVDGLKPVNDLYGHAVGDLLLQEMARALRGVFRGEDIVARLGGDEFVVLAIGDNLDASELINRLLQEMEAVSRDRAPDHPLADQGLQASVGAVSYDPEATMAELLAHADAAMYRSKLLRRAPTPRSSPERSTVSSP